LGGSSMARRRAHRRTKRALRRSEGGVGWRVTRVPRRSLTCRGTLSGRALVITRRWGLARTTRDRALWRIAGIPRGRSCWTRGTLSRMTLRRGHRLGTDMSVNALAGLAEDSRWVSHCIFEATLFFPPEIGELGLKSAQSLV
jgi:hypothetical protein